MIWRGLVYRPPGIVPSIVKFVSGYKYREAYKYRWDEARSTSLQYGQRPANGIYMFVDVHWTSIPTAEQMQLLGHQVKGLPTTVDEKTRTVTEHFICQGGNGSTKVLNRRCLKVEGLWGSSLMRTCKKINTEVAEMLYGMNQYIFDTRYSTPMASPLHEDDIRGFDLSRVHIPGLPDQYGRIRGREQLLESLQRMFDMDAFQPSLMWENPFTNFLRRIGPYNASLLTRIKFEGHFKVGRTGTFETDPRPLGFAQLLPVYQTILYNICGNLQELTLHTGGDKNRHYFRQINSDNPDIKGPPNTTNEQKVYNAVRLLVQGLPGLKKLQLGDYESLEDPEVDVEWGTSRIWMERVAARISGDMDAFRPSAFPLAKGPALRKCRGRGVCSGHGGGGRSAPIDRGSRGRAKQF
jgi:hypothetical protein